MPHLAGLVLVVRDRLAKRQLCGKLNLVIAIETLELGFSFAVWALLEARTMSKTPATKRNGEKALTTYFILPELPRHAGLQLPLQTHGGLGFLELLMNGAAEDNLLVSGA